MIDRLTKLGVLGGVVVVLVSLYIFYAVVAVANPPRFEDIPATDFVNDIRTLMIAIGGGAVAFFGARTNGNGS